MRCSVIIARDTENIVVHYVLLELSVPCVLHVHKHLHFLSGREFKLRGVGSLSRKKMNSFFVGEE